MEIITKIKLGKSMRDSVWDVVDNIKLPSIEYKTPRYGYTECLILQFVLNPIDVFINDFFTTLFRFDFERKDSKKVLIWTPGNIIK